MSGKRDHQRSRVYAWENRVIAPRDPTFISFAAAQAIVDAIWPDMGLRYPPAVEPLPAQARATLACADRLSIFLPERTPSWRLLHEIAHSMTSTADGCTDGQGPLFMGMYVRLIARYLRLELDELAQSLNHDGVEVYLEAQPLFI